MFYKNNFTIAKKELKKNVIIWIMLGIILGAGILISFPYYVNWCGLKEEEFRTFVSVYSAFVGGGLTLFGVAWTIRYNWIVKKEEEENKGKPYFQFIPNGMNATGGQNPIDGFVDVSFFKKNGEVNELGRTFFIKNVGGLFILEIIKCDDTYKQCRKTLIAENNTVLLRLNLNYNAKGQSIYLKLYGRDKLGNCYCFTMENKIIKQNNAYYLDVEYVGLPIKIDEEDMQAIYKEIENAEN